MIFDIPLACGPIPSQPGCTKAQMQRSIDAVMRASRVVPACDFTVLVDVASILRSMQAQLPGEMPKT